jgi:hypothetical protein
MQFTVSDLLTNVAETFPRHHRITVEEFHRTAKLASNVPLATLRNCFQRIPLTVFYTLLPAA